MQYLLNILKVLIAVFVPGFIALWLFTTFVPGFSSQHRWLVPLIGALCAEYGREVIYRNHLDQYRERSILHYTTVREKARYIAVLAASLIIMGLIIELVQDWVVLGLLATVLLLVAILISNRRKPTTRARSNPVG
jgi:predicted histidine transporter YuiF (NhaC family)